MTVFKSAWVKLSMTANCWFGYNSQTSSFHQVWRVRLRVNAMLFLSLYFALILRLCVKFTCHQCRQKTIDTKTTCHKGNEHEYLHQYSLSIYS